MKTRTWPVFGVALAVLWLLVRGVELAIDAVLGQFLLGLVVGMPVAFLFRRFYPDEIDPVRGATVVPWAVLYVLTFLKEVVVANLDVAYRAVAPGPPVNPEVILVPLRVESDLAVTTIANTITLTPGTIALDHEHESNALYVHVIDGDNVEGFVAPIRAWEDYAIEIFDEDAVRGERPEVLITGGEEYADEVVGRDAPTDDRGRTTDVPKGGETGGD